MTLPRDVELCIRTQPATDESIWFLLNYAGSAQEIALEGAHLDLLTAATVAGRVSLEPYGVLALRV